MRPINPPPGSDHFSSLLYFFRFIYEEGAHMISLGRAIPDADQLLEMEPETLAAKVLFLIRSEYGAAKFCPRNIRLEFSNFRDKYPDPPGRLGDVDSALAESFAWVDAQGGI
jgi:hypothetical protein